VPVSRPGRRSNVSLLVAAVLYGIIAVVFAMIAYGRGGKPVMRSYVSSHKLYFRTVAIILILSDLVIVSALIAGHHA
jgi:hypothetical protein